jgi:hypothetical protein
MIERCSEKIIESWKSGIYILHTQLVSNAMKMAFGKFFSQKYSVEDVGLRLSATMTNSRPVSTQWMPLGFRYASATYTPLFADNRGSVYHFKD